MLTDAPPRKSTRSQFVESDGIKTLDLPQGHKLLMIAHSVDTAMQAGVAGDVRRACAEFLALASGFYKVPNCGSRVLAARPLRVREDWASELFGDYNPETMLVRVWMRTAIRKEMTSYGTFLSTLCHKFCHHLDFQHFGFPDSCTPAAFTNEPLPSTITLAIQPRKNWFGCQYQAHAGELTGRAQSSSSAFLKLEHTKLRLESSWTRMISAELPSALKAPRKGRTWANP